MGRLQLDWSSFRQRRAGSARGFGGYGRHGKGLLTAVVAAYEVYQRIAMAVQPSDDWDWLVKGWGLTTWQTFAATIPAAKLLKLDAQKTAQAIGIAGLVSPIVNPKPHVTMSDVKPYQYGLITKDGITAALLAESGIDGLHDVLTARTATG